MSSRRTDWEQSADNEKINSKFMANSINSEIIEI